MTSLTPSLRIVHLVERENGTCSTCGILAVVPEAVDTWTTDRDVYEKNLPAGHVACKKVLQARTMALSPTRPTTADGTALVLNTRPAVMDALPQVAPTPRSYEERGLVQTANGPREWETVVTVPPEEAAIIDEVMQGVVYLVHLASRMASWKGRTQNTSKLITETRKLALELQGECEDRKGPGR